MSSPLKGHLRNTPIDIVLDTVLSVAVVAAWIPQINRIRTSSSTRGISPFYLLFNAFFSNAQLSHGLMLAAYGYPTPDTPVLEEISLGHLKGAAAYGAVLGFVQIFLQWACCITSVIQYSASSTEGRPNGRQVPIAAFLHAAVVLFPMAAIALPKPARRDFGVGIFVGLTNYANMIVGAIFGVLQFCAQYREMRSQKGDPGAFSLQSLTLQLLVIAILAMRWFLRLGTPAWNSAPDSGPPPPSAWYAWGFPAINCVFYAVGCAILLTAYSFTARMSGSVADREPLLG